MAEAESPTNSDISTDPLTSTPSNSKWPQIGHWDSVPLWLRDNEFIRTGHPLPTFSLQKSFRLWFCIHNEFVNIHSHAFGSSLALAAGAVLLAKSYTPDLPPSASLPSSAGLGDRLAFAAFFGASALCFGFSAIFHTLRSHSYNVHHFWGRMDIIGINILVLGGGVSANYYALHCHTTLQRIYWITILGSCVLASSTLVVGKHRSPKWRTLRGGVFALLGLSAMLPIIHGIGRLGWVNAKQHIGAQWYLLEAISLLTGVTLFVTRLPEKLRPGSFDIWGNSHQLFHFCAVGAMVFHFFALRKGFEYVHSTSESY
ncbi:HlyIII-domain-containing protein [Lindgomyces ingoldianus]|uniref:HlyIII-domain-containing protein n=1 Tax=Lindgomyces ingoldianus TaxID=673940 RepID=A0ACB6QKB1_9PLEO|nr:HlyIII-domain-containing protein [Lindgomyces ingoldianus]KAF2467373.1 HlyIII-domain-containing protein [Lindgomyces ingoldianus]